MPDNKAVWSSEHRDLRKQNQKSTRTIKDGVIEIQGEQRAKIAGVLQKLGYKVKIAGG